MLARDEGRLALHGGEVAFGQVGGSAPQFRQQRAERVQHLPGRLAGGHALLARAGRWAAPSPSRRAARARPAGRTVPCGSPLALAHAAKALVPLAACAALPRSMTPRACATRSGGLGEGDRRVEAEDLLGLRDLLGAQRRAVRRAGVLLVRGGPADDRPQLDHGRAPGLVPGRDQRVVEGLDVLGVAAVLAKPVDVLHVPPVGRVPRRDVLGLGDLRVVLDGDVVVVVDQDQVAELLVGGQGGRLVGDALLDVAVRGDHVHVVVEWAGARLRVGVEQAALAPGGHGHAHGVRQALPERAGRRLHPGRQPVLRVPGSEAAPRPVLLEVLQAQPVPGQVELDVQGQAGVPAGQHETVPPGPRRVGRVVPENPLEQQVRGRGEAHGRAGVPRSLVLYGVHGQDPDQVHGALVDVRPLELVFWLATHRLVTAPLCR